MATTKTLSWSIHWAYLDLVCIQLEWKMIATRAYSIFALILFTPQIKIDPIFPKWVNMELHIVRVEKTREQHEHARGTLRDLPRNTQAQKQRIISPIIAWGGKRLTIDTTNEYKKEQDILM